MADWRISARFESGEVAMKTAPEQVEEHHESHHHHAAPDGSSRRDRTVIFTTVIGVVAFVVFGIPYVKRALYSDTDPHDHGVNNSDVPVRDLDRGRRISENDVAPVRGRSENNPPIDRRDSVSDAARDRGRPISDVDRERHHPETDARPERDHADSDHADSDHAKIGRADSDRVSDRRGIPNVIPFVIGKTRIATWPVIAEIRTGTMSATAGIPHRKCPFTVLIRTARPPMTTAIRIETPTGKQSVTG